MGESDKDAIRAMSDQVSSEVKSLINEGDIESLKQTQHLILGRLQDSNAVLSHFNEHSENCFTDVMADFTRNTRLMNSMKTDLDHIFLKLRSMKAKVSATYPDAFHNESSQVLDTRPNLEMPVTMTSGVSQKPAGCGYEAALYDAKAVEGSGRALHEYQFLPEQPTVRSESYERVSQSHFYGLPSDAPGTMTPLSGGQTYLHRYEDVPVAYAPCQSLISQQGKLQSTMPSASGDYDSIAHKSPYMGMGMESPFSSHPITGHVNALMPSDRIVVQEDEAVRMERKRKSDESRIAKEVEVHEKRMRKELEKQDILRQKREEQMKKEMERQDRERKKEEEREKGEGRGWRKVKREGREGDHPS